MPLTPLEKDAIAAAIHADNKILAIKLHRQASGFGLAEAKHGVEKLEAELRNQHPERFAAPAKRSGCLGVLLLAAFGGTAPIHFAGKIFAGE